jgi:hypothetical protein
MYTIIPPAADKQTELDIDNWIFELERKILKVFTVVTTVHKVQEKFKKIPKEKSLNLST